jgi:hypothetical protein
VQEHGLVVLLVGVRVLELGAAALDLHAASRFVLDVLDVGAARTDDLGAQVEARDRLEVDGDLLLGPLALLRLAGSEGASTYPSKFVALKLVRIAAAEAPLVDEVGEVLLHHLLDLGNGLLEAFFAGARDVQVQRRGLDY